MSNVPQASGKETIKALQKIGFIISSQKGSHVKLTRVFAGQKQTIIVPMHKVLKKGTLRNGILKPISLTVEDFRKLI